MPERIQREEDPIQPLSLSSFWRTTMAQMEVFRDRPAPTCAFLLALATWTAAGCRVFWPSVADPAEAGACLLPDTLFAPHPGEWRRYILHPFWPLETGYLRAFLTSSALLLEGYTLEHDVGTLHFAGVLVGVHLATAALLLHFRFAVCYTSLEATIVATAVVLHCVNPKVHTDGLDKSLRVPFAIEPRWHLWVLQILLLMVAGHFPRALVVHVAGLAVGAALALRDPEVWVGGWRATRARSFGVGAAVHVTLFVFALLFMPLCATGGGAGEASLHEALMDGQVLRPSWWKAAFPGSPALLYLGMAGGLSAEALWICKLRLTFAVPLWLSPFRMWTRFYSVACALLAMYTMNSPVWQCPHVGFVVLVYLTWAFWRLPSVELCKPRTA